MVFEKSERGHVVYAPIVSGHTPTSKSLETFEIGEADDVQESETNPVEENSIFVRERTTSEDSPDFFDMEIALSSDP